jgi:hypothetical protein
MSKTSTKSHWLKHQLESANKELGKWPDWMRSQARFVGGNPSDDSPRIRSDQHESSTTLHKSKKAQGD